MKRDDVPANIIDAMKSVTPGVPDEVFNGAYDKAGPEAMIKMMTMGLAVNPLRGMYMMSPELGERMKNVSLAARWFESQSEGKGAASFGILADMSGALSDLIASKEFGVLQDAVEKAAQMIVLMESDKEGSA